MTVAVCISLLIKQFKCTAHKTISVLHANDNVTFSFTSQNFTDWFSVGDRCDTPDILLEKGCARDQLEFPVSKSHILQDRPLGKKTGSVNSTQISPQKMALQLRPGTRPPFDSMMWPTKCFLDFRRKIKVCVVLLHRQSVDFPG